MLRVIKYEEDQGSGTLPGQKLREIEYNEDQALGKLRNKCYVKSNTTYDEDQGSGTLSGEKFT